MNIFRSYDMKLVNNVTLPHLYYHYPLKTYVFLNRRILLLPAQLAAGLEPSRGLWFSSPSGYREALPTLPVRPASAGCPGLERGEGEGLPCQQQCPVTDPPTGPLQARRILFYLLLVLRLWGRRLLPGPAHPPAPAAPQAAARGWKREGGRTREGRRERFWQGFERQHKKAEEGPQPWSKGQR